MRHPLSIAGAVVFAGSWLLLLFGSGADEYRSIINLHKLVIAHAGIVSGLGMIVAGILVNGMPRLSAHWVQEPNSREEPAPAITAAKERTMSPEELSKALAEARAKLDERQF